MPTARASEVNDGVGTEPRCLDYFVVRPEDLPYPYACRTDRCREVVDPENTGPVGSYLLVVHIAVWCRNILTKC
jgi:hypothetical protein